MLKSFARYLRFDILRTVGLGGKPHSHHSPQERFIHAFPNLIDEHARSNSTGCRVLVYDPGIFWTPYLMSLALMLQARGNQVTLITHHDNGYVSGDGPIYPDQFGPIQVDIINHEAQIAQRSWTDDEIVKWSEIARMTAQHRFHRLRLPFSPEIQQFIVVWCKKLFITELYFQSYIQRVPFDIALTGNGLIGTERLFHQIVTSLGKSCATIEFGGSLQHGVVFSNTSPAGLGELRHEWNEITARSLTEKEHADATKLFEDRIEYQRAPDLKLIGHQRVADGTSILKTRLGLDDRPLILVATNVGWDSAVLGMHILYEDMIEWLTVTLDRLNKRQDIQVVIRVHPAELFGTNEYMGDVVRFQFPSLPEHFRLIEAEDHTNTYDLMKLAYAGIVYTNTVGLEMAYLGKPVVVCGSVYYRNCGMTIDPETRFEYEALLQSETLVDLTAPTDAREMALKWIYIRNYRWARPFPWHVVSGTPPEAHGWNLEICCDPSLYVPGENQDVDSLCKEIVGY